MSQLLDYVLWYLDELLGQDNGHPLRLSDLIAGHTVHILILPDMVLARLSRPATSAPGSTLTEETRKRSFRTHPTLREYGNRATSFPSSRRYDCFSKAAAAPSRRMYIEHDGTSSRNLINIGVHILSGEVYKLIVSSAKFFSIARLTTNYDVFNNQQPPSSRAASSIVRQYHTQPLRRLAIGAATWRRGSEAQR